MKLALNSKNLKGNRSRYRQILHTAAVSTGCIAYDIDYLKRLQEKLRMTTNTLEKFPGRT